MKYSHINEAQAQMEHLADALRRYQAELGDVPDLAGEANVDLRPGEFTWTLDLFLDNLFTDGMVLHQITQAGDRLGALKSRVEILQDRLERKREENQAALDQACAGRDQMASSGVSKREESMGVQDAFSPEIVFLAGQLRYLQ